MVVTVVLVVMKGMHRMNGNETGIMMTDRDAFEERRYLLMTTCMRSDSLTWQIG